ncbi:hypothetical protein N2152v2_005321 [Parachlorella kessleri]
MRGMGVDNSPHYATLPHSLWETVLQRVDDVRSIASLACCSREFYELAASDVVWKHAYQAASCHAAANGTCGVGMPNPCWKHIYKLKQELEACWREGRCAESRLCGHQDYIRCLELHPPQGPGQGARVISASGSFEEADCSIRVWDVGSGACHERLVGHEGPIWCMQSDGGRLVASAGDDGTLRLWDLHTHRVGVSRLLGPNRLSCLSWDIAAGRLAAGSAEGGVAVWSVDTILESLEEEVRAVGEGGAGEDAPALQAVEYDCPEGGGEGAQPLQEETDFPVWREVALDAADPPTVARVPPPHAASWPAVTCMQLEGDLLVTGEGGGEGRVHMWTLSPASDPQDSSPATPPLWRSHPATTTPSRTSSLSGSCSNASRRSCSSVAISRRRSSDGGWDWSHGRHAVLPRVAATLAPHKGGVSCLVHQPESGLLAVGSALGEIRLWDVSRCLPLHTLGGHTRDVLCMQLGSTARAAGPWSGQLLASGSADKTVRTWDARQGGGSCSVQKLKSMPYCLQVEGYRAAAGCADGKVYVWDLRGITKKPLVLPGHRDRVWALAMDASTLVSAGLDGNIILRSFLPAAGA